MRMGVWEPALFELQLYSCGQKKVQNSREKFLDRDHSRPKGVLSFADDREKDVSERFLTFRYYHSLVMQGHKKLEKCMRFSIWFNPV